MAKERRTDINNDGFRIIVLHKLTFKKKIKIKTDFFSLKQV